MNIKDEYGEDMHPWLFSDEERYLYVPLESRDKVKPILLEDGTQGMETLEECALYDLTAFLEQEGIEVTMGNANALSYAIEEQHEKPMLN